MAIWMELRCDSVISTRPHGCHSNMNEGPMELSHNNRRDVIDTVRMIELQAIEKGWRRIGYNWYCPACLKARNV